MAKKKRKRSKASTVSPVTEEPKVEVKKPPKKSPKKEDWRFKDICGVCQKKRKQTIAFFDGDEHWELPGHPDHINRPVCINCEKDYKARGYCAQEVYEAMRVTLRDKGVNEHDIERAVHVAWRSFWVDLDDKELISMARKLKVKHPWLKGKRSK